MMPSDLIRYEEEFEKQHDLIKAHDRTRFVENSVHIMNLASHAFYVKDGVPEEEEVVSSSASESLHPDNDIPADLQDYYLT